MGKKAEFVTQAAAAKLVGLTRAAINNKANLKKVPSWLVKVPGRKALMVDVDSDEFLEFVTAAKKRSNASGTTTKKPKPKPKGSDPGGDPEVPELTPQEARIEQMRMAAKEAKYQDEIDSSKMKHFKLEQEILKLKRAAGDLLTWKEGEQVWFGYMDRINLKILGSPKKQENKITQFVADEIIRDFDLDSVLDIEQLKITRKKLKISSIELAKKIINLITRDNEAELEEVRRLQEKEVINFHNSLEDNGVS